MATVALISNPMSTGNREVLPRVREFAARSSEIFHYEIGAVEEVPAALKTIALTKPKVLVINGGDGTVQSILTELQHGKPFGDAPPPLAVLPNGKTNLIALDLGAGDDALKALQRILDIAETGVEPHLTARKLISLNDGQNERPVMGMFLGGAGLASSILFCRHKLYPLGIPNWMAHVLTTITAVLVFVVGLRWRWIPLAQKKVSISVRRQGRKLEGSFFLLMITTLERVLMNVGGSGAEDNRLGMMVIEQGRGAVMKAAWSTLKGRLGADPFKGMHLDSGDEIRITGEGSDVILDGEHFRAPQGGSLVLTPTAPVSFLKLAA